jgi:hypothetical protein
MFDLRHRSAKAACGIAALAGFLFVSAVCTQAQSPRQPSTGYDKSWQVFRVWPGEYPSGFAVISRKVVVTGRAKLDKNAPRNVKCELPYLAVIHPWNQARQKKSNIYFWSATRIVPLQAKVDFTFEDANNSEAKIPIKAGDIIEYLAPGAEGFFTVRIGGKLHTASQDLFQQVEDVPREKFDERDEWFALNCPQGRRAYFLYPDDLADSATPGRFQAGLIEYAEPNGGGYGKMRDLTEAEARAARAKESLP